MLQGLISYSQCTGREPESVQETGLVFCIILEGIDPVFRFPFHSQSRSRAVRIYHINPEFELINKIGCFD